MLLMPLSLMIQRKKQMTDSCLMTLGKTPMLGKASIYGKTLGEGRRGEEGAGTGGAAYC